MFPPSGVPILRSSRKSAVLGSYPTEVQAALAYDDVTRAAIAASSTPSADSATSAPSGNSSNAATTTTGVTADNSALTPIPASASASASNSTKDEPPPPLNFRDDAEAQERLDEIAIFEAGLEKDGLTEVDPTLVLVKGGKGGRLRRKRPLEGDDGRDNGQDSGDSIVAAKKSPAVSGVGSVAESGVGAETGATLSAQSANGNRGSGIVPRSVMVDQRPTGVLTEPQTVSRASDVAPRTPPREGQVARTAGSSGISAGSGTDRDDGGFQSWPKWEWGVMGAWVIYTCVSVKYAPVERVCCLQGKICGNPTYLVYQQNITSASL